MLMRGNPWTAGQQKLYIWKSEAPNLIPEGKSAQTAT